MATCKGCFHYNVCYKKPIRSIDEDLVVIGGCSDYKPTADVVEVPCRCEKCKYYVAEYCTRDIKGRTNMFYMQPTDFCSYGERRDT